MGLPENPTGQPENQERRRRQRLPRRPRTRRCLRKGWERRFHPRQPQQRYCSEGWQKAARKWARWKAQQRYRAMTAGKQKRNGQSERYRERVRSRNRPEKEAVGEAARVIAEEVFSGAAATGRVATSDTGASGEVRCNASVPRRAGAPWSVSNSGSGAGNNA